ncbi:AAA family ATPase [Candidatus Saccharibacteria bacterium]|nr:AAA family ATPase [Candidatus Saccharibacteria bacterium]
MNYKIIAFTGLPMVGKSTAREQLESLLDEKGISHEYVHFGSTEEVEHRNSENLWSEEQNSWTMEQKERFVREEWRAERGMGVMAEKMLPKIKSITDSGKLVIIDNMYSDEERHIIIEEFGDDNFLVIAVTADWEVRVERASKREYRPLSAVELKERDEAEIYNLHKAPTIALAHFTFVNNGQTKEELREDIKSRILKV